MSATREITPQSLAVVGASLIGTMCNGMTFASIAISVFIGQIAADYHWSRAQVGGATSLLFVGMAVGSFLFGRPIDRFGPRVVLLPLTLVSGLTLASFSFIGPVLPLFYAAHLVLGASQPGAIAYSKLLSSWFFRYRGIALTALGFGTFVANVAMPPIARSLQASLGWHGAYRALSLAELLIALPVLIAFFRERKSALPGAGTAEGHEVHQDGAPAIGVRRAMAGSTYWLLLGAQVGGVFAYIGTSTHAIGIMTERGVDPALAVWGLSIFAVGGMIAQIITGYLFDRFDTPRVMLPFAIGTLASLLLLQVARGDVVTLSALLLFGMGCGGLTSMSSYYTTRYFGVRNFGTIYGSLFPILLVLCAPSPIIIGAIFDATKSYGAGLLMIDAALVLAIVCFWLLRPYPYPVKATPLAPTRHQVSH